MITGKESHKYVAYICCMTQVNWANVTGRDRTCCRVTLCFGKKVKVEERNGGRIGQVAGRETV